MADWRQFVAAGVTGSQPDAMVGENGRVVVGCMPRAEPFGLGHYGNFDPCGRSAARGQGHNHVPALGGVIDFGATPPTQPLP
jgi:hypothetical protein